MALSKTQELQWRFIERLERMQKHLIKPTHYYKGCDTKSYIIFESLVIVRANPPGDNNDLLDYTSILSSQIYDLGIVGVKYYQQAVRDVIYVLTDVYFKVSGEKWPYVID
jgi:hypothetical protein